MRTPEGLSGDKTDKIMLLNNWARALEKESTSPAEKPMIFAGMGKPTFRVNRHLVEAYLYYWLVYFSLVKNALAYPSKAKLDAAINYGNGYGDLDSRTTMAKAMSKWYNIDNGISADNILFTAGGAGALHVIFETLNDQDKGKYRVITPFPHYTLYASNKKHILHPIDVMNEPGYRLTAAALEKSIAEANKLAETDGRHPRSILLCNPSNPLGTVISEQEWKDIAKVLVKHPNLKIVIDEAYAEMYWKEGNMPSILKAAPELKNRTIILRSATKALSAAGERAGMLMAFDPELMNSLRNKNITYIGHAPRATQRAYAHAMNMFDDNEKQALKDFYLPKVQYIQERAHAMGAAMPDPLYSIDSTFYVLCDLSDLLGEEIPKGAERALGRTGTIETSEELIYSLLFKESLMVAAGSYFGMPPHKGIVRITCSGEEAELQEIMNRIENWLLQARIRKKVALVDEVKKQLDALPANYSEQKKAIDQQLANVLKSTDSLAAQFKATNIALTGLLNTIKAYAAPNLTDGLKAAPRISLPLRRFSFLTQSTALINDPNVSNKYIVDLNTEWVNFVNSNYTEGKVKNYMLNLDEEDKATIQPWLEHKKALEITLEAGQKELDDEKMASRKPRLM